MNQRTHRSFVCSLLFLDIPGYSKKTVKEQLNLRQRINTALHESLANVPAEDRIVLEVANGTVVNFLGHPELALFVAQYLINAMTPRLSDAAAASPGGTQVLPVVPIRIGINLGPVRVNELDGQYSVAGDGISVAERLVGFAQSGQVMVSQAYFEVVSKLATGYRERFHFEGVRTDENVREYAVHLFDTTGALLDPPVKPPAVPDGEAADDRPVRGTVMAGALFIAISLVVMAWGWRHTNGNASPRAETPAVAAAFPSVSVAKVDAPPKAGLASAVSPVASSKEGATSTTAVASRADAAPAPRVPPSVKTAPASVPTPVVGEKLAEATVTLIVSPWGEVSVDGKKIGVSPPMKRLSLTPGIHEIEINNSGFPVFRQKIEAKSGSSHRLEHRFQ